MHVNALTDVGLVRKDNEDNYLVSADRGLFVVADGMGGHLGGAVASSMAIKVIDEEIREPHLEENPSRLLHTALLKANSLILQQGQSENLCGMGTTVTAALFQKGSIYIAHIGDSRAYLYRDQALTLLTQDHSLVNELLQKGGITVEEAQYHPQRNILTRALGTQVLPQIDFTTTPALPGDMLLLCTDGLSNHVSDQEIKTVLSEESNLKEKVKHLVNLALERGGNDNITVVLVQYE
ncbi:MAG: protein serine/threonine phosphatase [Peptococcaceae bacterium]|jgi:protein phosphatase|nr:protein serine/threonine phosphatase [Peptococcaceae bacterium]